MRISLKNITKKFGSVTAVDNVSLSIRSGEFIALLGPSGCGKTTTLLTLAGIYQPTAGEIRFDDEIVNDFLPAERNVGMVFQSYALYPHMTVYKNLAYPLRLKRLPRNEIDERVRRVAESLEIGHLLDRKPGQLSGGQQQRVGLGRALVKEPDVLLFDEPLSNLDARLRLTMRSELKRLQRELGITSIYVTHDQVEAMTMADRIAVMSNGRVMSFGSPAELYDRPDNLFVASFIGNPPMNFLDVILERREDEPAEGSAFRAHCPGFEVEVPEDTARKALQGADRRRVILGIRPENLHLDGDTVGAGIQLGKPITARIAVVEPLGRDDLLECQVEDTVFHVLAPFTGIGTMGTVSREVGAEVRLRPDLRKLHLFDPDSQQSLLTEPSVRHLAS